MFGTVMCSTIADRSRQHGLQDLTVPFIDVCLLASNQVPAMLQVTKDNFSEVLPIVEQALKDCHFYAFDCEMTGLKHTYNDSISYFADMQERYAQVSMSGKATT